MNYKHIITLGFSYLRQQKWWKKGYGYILTGIIALVMHFAFKVNWGEVGIFLETLR
jgi:hypothetical protein